MSGRGDCLRPVSYAAARPWGRVHREPGVRVVAGHDHERPQGTGGGAAPAGSVRRPGGGRRMLEIGDPEMPSRPKRSSSPRRAGGSATSAPLDQQEHARALGGPDGADIRSATKRSRNSCVPCTTACKGIGRRKRGTIPGSGCAVSVHQRRGPQGTRGTSAGHFGRHQEEGVARQLHERGRQWLPAQSPTPVNVHDFPRPPCPAYPYGIYDLAATRAS